ncbi:hypothetical protein ABVK25_009614, partial [Lepraria finkii]
NIYRIWIPSRKQVIRIRDVTFDEKTHYQLHDIDAAQLVQEQELYHTIQILQEIPESLLAYNQDEQELEIPSNTTTTPSTINKQPDNPPTIDKQPDKATTNESQPYISPPPSDTGDIMESSPTPPPMGTPAGNGEGA